MGSETTGSPFPLRIAFSGLCHYVPIGHQGGVSGLYKDGVYVMFPLADEHRAKIEFLKKQGNDYKVVADLSILFGEVTLEITTSAGSKNGVTVKPFVNWVMDASRPNAKVDVYGALPFDKIASGLADRDQAIVRSSPKVPGLRARLQLTDGYLEPDLGPKETVAFWRLPKPIGGMETTIAIGLGFELKIPDVIAAKFTVRTMFSTESVDLSMHLYDGEVFVRIANRCDRVEKGTIDLDFEHHYKMIQAGIYKKRLELGLVFPVPQLLKIVPKLVLERIAELQGFSPRTGDQEVELRELLVESRSIVSGSGCNCLGALGLARTIPVDPA